MRIIVIALAGVSLLAATSAQAQSANDGTGFYMAVNVGVSTLSDPDVTYYDAGGTFGGTGARDTASAKLDTSSAATFGGSLGYDFGSVRADIEVNYVKNSIKSLSFVSVNGSTVALTAAQRADVCDYLEATPCGGSGNTFTVTGSRVRQLSAMGNLWLDLPLGNSITPYVGGGIGISGFEVDGEGKGKFAWQLGAGLAIKLSPGLALTTDYRHRVVSRTNVPFDSASGYQISSLKTDSITAGLRVTF